MMIIDNTYEVGDVVYLKSDNEQLKRIVLGIMVKQKGVILYELVQGTVVSDHYDIEISRDKDLSMIEE